MKDILLWFCSPEAGNLGRFLTGISCVGWFFLLRQYSQMQRQKKYIQTSTKDVPEGSVLISDGERTWWRTPSGKIIPAYLDEKD